jgi:hypothetical protein
VALFWERHVAPVYLLLRGMTTHAMQSQEHRTSRFTVLSHRSTKYSSKMPPEGGGVKKTFRFLEKPKIVFKFLPRTSRYLKYISDHMLDLSSI